MRASDFEHPEGQTESKTDYNALTWIKSKVAFSLMHANLSVFIFDSDVIFFDVPDLVEIQATKPDGIIFFQLASIEDEEGAEAVAAVEAEAAASARASRQPRAMWRIE